MKKTVQKLFIQRVQFQIPNGIARAEITNGEFTSLYVGRKLNNIDSTPIFQSSILKDIEIVHEAIKSIFNYLEEIKQKDNE